MLGERGYGDTWGYVIWERAVKGGSLYESAIAFTVPAGWD